jgi:hypothetical protein
MIAMDLRRRVEAIQEGHGDVEEHDVRGVLRHRCHRGPTIGALGHHLDVGQILEQRPHPGAHQVVIVGDDDANHAVTGRSTAMLVPCGARGVMAT